MRILSQMHQENSPPSEGSDSLSMMFRTLKNRISPIWVSSGIFLCLVFSAAYSAPLLQTASTTEPTPSVDSLREQAKDLSEQGLHANALILWERVAEEDPGARSWFDLGRARMLASKLEGARSAFQEVLKIHPNHTRTLLSLGNVERRAGDLQRSLHWYQKALEQDPSYIYAYFNVAEVLEELGQQDQALGAWLAALDQTPQSPSDQQIYNDCVQRAAAAYLARGDAGAALELASQLAKAQPNHPEVHYTLGHIWLALEDETKAEEAFERHAAIVQERISKGQK